MNDIWRWYSMKIWDCDYVTVSIFIASPFPCPNSLMLGYGWLIWFSWASNDSISPSNCQIRSSLILTRWISSSKFRKYDAQSGSLDGARLMNILLASCELSKKASVKSSLFLVQKKIVRCEGLDEMFDLPLLLPYWCLYVLTHAGEVCSYVLMVGHDGYDMRDEWEKGSVAMIPPLPQEVVPSGLTPILFFLFTLPSQILPVSSISLIWVSSSVSLPNRNGIGSLPSSMDLTLRLTPRYFLHRKTTATTPADIAKTIGSHSSHRCVCGTLALFLLTFW